MNTNRLGPRKPGNQNRPLGRPERRPDVPDAEERPERADRAARRRAIVSPPGKDRTALFVGLGVGGVFLVIALAMAMSSGSESSREDNSAERGLKEAMESAHTVGQAGDLQGALELLEHALRDPAYQNSKLAPKARSLADDYRKQITFEREAAAAIEGFKKRVDQSKADQTAMKKADAHWQECNDLIAKYGQTAKSRLLREARQDLERWRATGAQDAWQDDYNRTKTRIQAHIDAGQFNVAVREWRRFAEPHNAPELKARIETELREIDKRSVEAAQKAVESAGAGSMARPRLEADMERFTGTEGQKIIASKLKSLP